MKIAGYQIKDHEDLRQIIIFKREHIEESGKKDVRFLVYGRDNPQFGIANSDFSQVAGMPVRGNKELIQTFLGNLIRTGEAKTCYSYIGAMQTTSTTMKKEPISIRYAYLTLAKNN